MKTPSSTRRLGFTLVEMLISVALVLLMMSLFASAFVQATGILATQRGIAENDQRGRMLSVTIRGDLNARTFVNVQPLLPGVAPPSPGTQQGYFEIDEGDPNDDTDDVLQFTVQSTTKGLKFPGLANNLTSVAINLVPTASSITVPGNFDIATSGLLSTNTYIWISGSTGVTSGGVPYTNDGRYLVSGTIPNAGPPQTTTIQLTLNNATPTPAPANLTPLTVAPTTTGQYGYALLSEFDPDFDDGIVDNGQTSAATAEVCYFLRAGRLYRRALLVRDNPASAANMQPQWSTSGNFITNTTVSPATPTPATITTTTFWRDFDNSAFFAPASISSQVNTNPPVATSAIPTPGFPTGPVFHDAINSLGNNPTNPASVSGLGTYLSLGLPYQRFGHSVNNGLPQDASTVAYLNGSTTNQISIGRFNLQECANQSFGYPGTVSGLNPNPFDRYVSNPLSVSPTTMLVTGYDTGNDRRGQDILLTNVLSFDVKVWDPINAMFVDIGSTTPVAGPFSIMPYGAGWDSAAPTAAAYSQPNPQVGGVNVSGYLDGVLYNLDPSGNPAQFFGRLNSCYGGDPSTTPYGLSNGSTTYGFCSSSDGKPHFRFDTWHPNAAIVTNTAPPYPTVLTPTSGPTTASHPGFYNQPPYFALNNPGYLTPANIPTAPYVYTYPPYMPAGLLATGGTYHAFVLPAIQLNISYRDVSSNQIRSMTIVQSLSGSAPKQRLFQCPTGQVLVPTMD